MLCVFPFHAGDAKKLANLLQWIQQLGENKKHAALLVADKGVDWLTAAPLLAQAKENFFDAKIITNEVSVIGWPDGPNSLFLAAAKFCEQELIEPWLFMETDAVPLRSSWLDDLQAEYFRLGTWVAGSVYDGNVHGSSSKFMSGVAMYNYRVFEEAGPFIKAAPGIAFDVTVADWMMEHGTDTVLIHHLWGEPNLPPTFVSTKVGAPRNAFTLNQISPHARIFHRNKDGSLIRLLREQRGIRMPGAVTPVSRKVVTVRRSAALGDVLSATCVAARLNELGYLVNFQAHPSAHCILRRVPGIETISEPTSQPDIDLDGAYESDPQRRAKHFAQMFFDRAGKQFRMAQFGHATNFAPRMVLTKAERLAARSILEHYPQPWTIIVPRSNSWANRTVPDNIWQQSSSLIQGTKFWLALHPAPPGFVDLGCRHFDTAIGLLGEANLVVTVDTGPMHVAAALGTPVVAIQQASSPELHLSDQRDFIMVSPPLTCLNCQIDLCPINHVLPPCQMVSPQLIADAANARLQATTGDGVSVVICIYKPNAAKLNRCLKDVLPQVDEIVIVSDMGGYVPKDAMQHPKIKYVRLKQHDVGYGRKANFGVRHTNHKWLLMLNDDVYLAPDAVALLRKEMAYNVGMVAHLLIYPDGTIQHGGTYRNPGDPGWGHLDHRARESRIKQVVEMENVCGASVLMRREAFYQAGGFDEDFYLYCEDNAMCLAIRQAGWKIIYTPFARGIHEESQSTSVTPGIHQIMVRSQETLKKKWGWYFELNKNNRMGVFE